MVFPIGVRGKSTVDARPEQYRVNRAQVDSDVYSTGAKNAGGIRAEVLVL